MEALMNELKYDAHCRKHKILMEDLREATHCHSCGTKFNVCFFGYGGRFCSKSCWRGMAWDNDGEGCREGCKYCYGTYSVSKARPVSNYYYDKMGCKTGVLWPMYNVKTPCTNECLRTKRSVYIPVYHDYWKYQ